MLTLYRRHLKDCDHADNRYWKRCRCPMWAQGTIEGTPVRSSLNTPSWERAEGIAREWENNGGKKASLLSVDEAVSRFLSDAQARHLSPDTIKKNTRLLHALKDKYPVRLKDVTLDDLRKFRETWKDGPLSAYKKTERLRSFFKFCHASGWMEKNPAAFLKNVTVKQKPTLPFSDEDWSKIVAATYEYPDNYGKKNQENAVRLRAFVYLLRYSGLRIRDAVMLKRDCLKDGKLFLHTSKTGVPVWLPLPPEVSAVLEDCPGPTTYFFWTGESSPKSSVGNWQRSIRKLMKLANVKGHAHMFRDTAAVSWLNAGIDIPTVATLLGNSAAIVEKHYSPWVKSRQDRLEQLVSATFPTPRLTRVK
jgi:integrase/recombinase XerD